MMDTDASVTHILKRNQYFTGYFLFLFFFFAFPSFHNSSHQLCDEQARGYQRGQIRERRFTLGKARQSQEFSLLLFFFFFKYLVC